MHVLLSVDQHQAWTATPFRADEDEEPPNDERLLDYLQPAIRFQIDQGGGVFIAAIPDLDPEISRS